MSKLKVLAKPCGSGTCPTLYQDDQGRIFIQGNQLVPDASAEIAIADHEAVVEIDAELLAILKSNQV